MPDPGQRVLSPELHEQSPAALTPVGSALDAVGLDPVHVNSAVRFGCAVLMQVFALARHGVAVAAAPAPVDDA